MPKLWKAKPQKRLRIYGKVNTGAAGVRIVLRPQIMLVLSRPPLSGPIRVESGIYLY